MRDKKFLAWLHERLRFQHSENPNVDYMWKLRAIIDSMSDHPDSKVTTLTPDELTSYAEEFDVEMQPTGRIVDPQSPS